MNRPLLLISTLALAAAMAAPLAAPQPANAQRRVQYQPQPSRNFDGFCYVRSNSVQADTETDYWGTRRGYGRCYRGEYYVYAGRYTIAPRAPDGYVARYFTRRPDRAFYDRVYSAESLTESFESDTRYPDTRYPDTRYSTQAPDARYAEYPAETYDRRTEPRRYDDTDTPTDADSTVGQYEQSAPSDDYARDSRTPDENGYIAPYDARPTYDEAEGWRDDQGAWHLGRPRAIGWQDEYGQWHEGQIQGYGWRDRYGEWHEARDDAQ